MEQVNQKITCNLSHQSSVKKIPEKILGKVSASVCAKFPRSIVISDKPREETEAEKLMAMRPERSKSLHNFDMPRLNWGTQRLLRCMNVNPNAEALSSTAVDRRFSVSGVENGKIVQRRERCTEPVMERRMATIKLFEKSLSPAAGVGGFRKKSKAESDREGRMEVVWGSVTFNLQAAGDKTLEESAEFETAESEVEPGPSRPRNAATGISGCCGSYSANGDVSKTSMAGSQRGDVTDAPTRETRKRRKKFSISLSQREIEEDLKAATGRRPPRRAAIIPKQLDPLFPGMYVAEIKPDDYKVPESAKTRKVITLFCSF
ncbi:Glucoamylase [Actinidia chinensis var. chinensis]|uniref:Glucoamylase n=1 Tax=Actinidia chinensis var. chinensis TaxID=1590841 RepID=A0A2R6PBA4_ACTCC|nr:Glucoamylase [Actinidia chinensis var. chinensis]